MRSSPRITWVMPMSMSSTALARKKIGAPSDRTITKSWISAHSTRTSPRMRSVKLLTPSSGVRNRIVRGPPLGRERDALVGGERAAVAVVARRAPGGDRRVVALLHLVLGAVALVGVALPRAGGRRRRGTRRSGVLWRIGPSSQSMPSQRRVSWIPTTHSSRLRATSVSSMRSTNTPAVMRGRTAS